MIGLKKKETNVEKKKRLTLIIVGLVFGLKFLLIIFFILYIANKISLFFWRKIKDATYVFQLREQNFLFGMLYINLLNLVWF